MSVYVTTLQPSNTVPLLQPLEQDPFSSETQKISKITYCILCNQKLSSDKMHRLYHRVNQSCITEPHACCECLASLRKNTLQLCCPNCKQEVSEREQNTSLVTTPDSTTNSPSISESVHTVPQRDAEPLRCRLQPRSCCMLYSCVATVIITIFVLTTSNTIDLFRN
jgi:hypothetical protein